MINKTVKLHSPCCNAKVMREYPDDEYARCSVCGKKYDSAAHVAEQEDTADKKAHRSYVIMSIVVGLVLILLTAWVYSQHTPDYGPLTCDDLGTC